MNISLDILFPFYTLCLIHDLLLHDDLSGTIASYNPYIDGVLWLV